MRIVLGVCGGIAAYKAATLLRLLTEAGHEVTVVPTEAALRFVGAPTWAALSGAPVAHDVWSDTHEVPHVRLGQRADLVLVAPATADLLARAAHGLADDLLTNVLLTARCPVLLAPAMHTEMWTHPATLANVASLRERGVQVLDPASGRLTGADTGPGRLPEPEDIARAALALLGSAGQHSNTAQPGTGQLAGRHVVVTAGGTREPLDPVRFLGNRSSGKQGYAVAQAALSAGARVTLLAANVGLPVPAGAHLVSVETALELQEAVRCTVADEADVVVMAAAVADFRPASYTDSKIKKARHGGRSANDAAASDLVLTLTPNPDILAGLVAERARHDQVTPVLVGFAAETGDSDGDVLEHARAKLASKGCDLLVANEVGRGRTFGQDETTVHLLTPGESAAHTVGPTSKLAVGEAVCAEVAALLRAGVRDVGDKP